MPVTERLALPGFLTPDHPKESMRVFARPDGRVELVLKDHVPLGESIPDYRVLISTEYGQEVHLQATVRTGNIVTIRNESDGTQKFVLRVGPPCMAFTPATYTVRAMENGAEVYFKNLTVLPHPEQTRLAQLDLAPIPGEIV